MRELYHILFDSSSRGRDFKLQISKARPETDRGVLRKQETGSDPNVTQDLTRMCRARSRRKSRGEGKTVAEAVKAFGESPCIPKRLTRSAT